MTLVQELALGIDDVQDAPGEIHLHAAMLDGARHPRLFDAELCGELHLRHAQMPENLRERGIFHAT